MGFALMLKNDGVDVCGKDVLLLGAGGAGRSVAKKLADAGANVFIIAGLSDFETSLPITARFNVFILHLSASRVLHKSWE